MYALYSAAHSVLSYTGCAEVSAALVVHVVPAPNVSYIIFCDVHCTGIFIDSKMVIPRTNSARLFGQEALKSASKLSADNCRLVKSSRTSSVRHLQR